MADPETGNTSSRSDTGGFADAPAAPPTGSPAAPRAGQKREKRLLVIVPAFNEQERIAAVVRGIRDNIARRDDIVVIDDGSTDRTARRARETGAIVLPLPFNSGYGAALKAGYRYALRHDYDTVVQMDADGQHDPAAIAALVEPVRRGEAKVIIGSRYLGGATYRVPPARRVGQWLFATILRLLTGKRVTDPTSGFQALHRDVLRLYVSEEFPADYPDADVLLLLHYKGLEFREAPAVFHDAAEGADSMHGGLRPFYYVYKMLLSMFLVACRYPRRGRPGS